VDTLLLVTSLLMGTAVTLIVLGFRMVTSVDSVRISSRIERSHRTTIGQQAEPGLGRQEQRGLLGAFESPLRNFRWIEDCSDELARAGVTLRVTEYLLMRVALSLLVAIVIVVAWAGVAAILCAVLVAILVWKLPAFWVRGRVVRRQRMLEDQLDGALTSISTAVRSGFSFLQAVQLTVPQLQWPLREEFELALEETQLGVTIEDALESMAKRARSYEVDVVINAVMVNRSVGGDLGEILSNVARTIRDRREMRGHIMSITAQQRMSAVFVAAVPVVMAGLLSLVSWQFMKPLWTTSTGNILLIIGVVLDFLGFLLMRRLTRIDY
jgi:tight adherence protein B